MDSWNRLFNDFQRHYRSTESYDNAAPQRSASTQFDDLNEWETTTFAGELRSTGFVAPITVDEPINGCVFLPWMEQHRVPIFSLG